MAIKEYYVKTNEGEYMVHFPNFIGYTHEQIIKTFSQFGKVAAVDLRGQTHGLVFVRYTKEDDVIACIIGLSKNSAIKILKHKSKTKSDHSQQNNEPPTSSPSKKHHPNMSTQKKHVSKQHLSNGPQQKTQIPSLFDLKPQYTKTNSISRANSVTGGSVSVASMCDMMNDSKSQLKSQFMATFNKSLSDRFSQSDIGSGQVSKMESNNPRTGSVAEDVIVANIQSSYGIHYILHMFQKFGPICVRQMKTIPQTNIRYCIVYFRTLQAAQSVQEEFDNFPLGGRNLIVIRSKSLIREIKLS